MTTPYKLKEHSKTHRMIGSDYESIIEEWHIYNPNQCGSYTIIKQMTPIGSEAGNWRIYSRSEMRNWQDGVKNKDKKKIIEEVKNWFDCNGIEWKTFNETYK